MKKIEKFGLRHVQLFIYLDRVKTCKDRVNDVKTGFTICVSNY